MEDEEINTLEELLAELARFRESVSRGEVDRSVFNAATAELQRQGSAFGIDFTNEITQLRQLGQLDVDLSGVIDQLRQLDQLARSGTITQDQFTERATRIQNAPIIEETGQGDSIAGEISRIEEAGDFVGAFGGSLAEAAGAAFLFFEGIGAVTGAIQGLISPIRRAIQLQEEFQSNVLKSQILFVSATRAFNEQGEEIFDSTQRLRESTKDFEELNKNLEIATQSIAGLTSARLTSVTREVTKNIGLIQGQSQELGSTLEIIEGLVPDIAGALATLGLPELQDTQEIRELLRGQFNDQRALLGVQLGISKQEADIARQQGRFVDLLRERLRPFVEGNKIASERLGSVLVNFQDSQEILARAFAEEFSPPLVEAANNLFEALVIGTQNQQFTDQINELEKLNSLTSQYNSIQQQLADTTGLSQGQIDQLNRSLAQNREAFARLTPEVQALEGVDTSQRILDLNKALLEVDPTPFETFQSFLQDLGRELGNTVDILIQNVENIVRTLDAVGITDAVVRGGEAVIEIIGTINAVLGFTTNQVTRLVEALKLLPGVTRDSGEATEAAFAGIRGEASKVPEEVEKTNEALASIASDSKDVGTSILRSIGLEALNAGLVRLATGIVANFGPLQRLISFLQGIPGLGRLITPLISQFGLLGRIIPGIGTALLALDAFKLAKNVTRELTGANRAVRDFVQQTETELDNFARSGEKVREFLGTIDENTTQERRAQIQSLAQNEIDAIQEVIRQKEQSLKTDREIRRELEAQGKSEDEIKQFLDERVNLSNVEKTVREEQTKAIEALRLEEEAIRKAAAETNVTLKSTRVEARALQDQGLISSTAVQNFNNAISDISNGIINVPDQLAQAVDKALVDAQFLVSNGLEPAADVSAKLVELAQNTTITTDQRKEILNTIVQIRKEELSVANSLIDTENQILDLRAEAGLVTIAELENEKAKNRLIKANQEAESARATIKDLEAALAAEELDDLQQLETARQDLAKAEAEQAAARTNIIATQGRLEAQNTRDAIKSAEQANQQLVNERRRAALEQGRFFQAEELQLRDQFELQLANVEAAEQRIEATQRELETNVDVNRERQLTQQLEQEITALSQARLDALEGEAKLIRDIANLEEQRIRDERRGTVELEQQERLARGFTDISEERLAITRATTELIAEEANLAALIEEGEQDQRVIDEQRLVANEKLLALQDAIVASANRQVDPLRRLDLEERARDGLISQAEKQLQLAFDRADITDEAIAELKEFISLNEGTIAGEEANGKLAELRLKRLEDTNAILEANVGLIEEELKLQRQVVSAGEAVLGRQQSLINKVAATIQQETQEVLNQAQENVAQSQDLVKQLEAGQLDESARLEAIRELGKIDPVAAAQAAQGRFEAAADSIRRREQEVARIKTNAAKEEEEIAEKRLKIEQAIEAIKLQSRLAEIQLEKAKADNIEDDDTRRGVLEALNAEERLIGVQQQFLEDPDSVDFDDIGSVFDAGDIDVSDVTRTVRSGNDAIRQGQEEAQANAQATAFKPLFESVETQSDQIAEIIQILKDADLNPEVNVSVNPGTLDPLLGANVLRGENP